MLAEGLLWAEEILPAFKYSRMHGGDPLKKDAYGYAGWTEDGGYVSVHNPSGEERDYAVTLDRALGMGAKMGTLLVSSPMEESVKDLPGTVKIGDVLKFRLAPGEIRLLHFDRKARDWSALRALQTRTPDPEPDHAIAAADDLVLILSGQLGMPVDAVTIVEAVETVWPNACLGFPAEGEICAEVLTPGFAVTLEAASQRFSYRTDETMERVRLVAAPIPDIGTPLAVWKDTRTSFATATVGSRGFALGLRGGPQLAVYGESISREEMMGQLLARFAPFQAVTEAGEIDFAGFDLVTFLQLLNLRGEVPMFVQHAFGRARAARCENDCSRVVGGDDRPLPITRRVAS